MISGKIGWLNKIENSSSSSSSSGSISCVSKNVQTLASSSFDKHGLILIIFSKQHISSLSQMMCLFIFSCPFTFAYFISC